ncbi:MAG: AAC(3) family N-acetyltransferase [Phycisphaerae bacterium]|nr:AAC(3) family N-acetyltransferase [Phycisphaerae bacterium]
MSDALSTPDLPLVTRAQLAEAFSRLGVAPGDVVLMHSSLKSLGRMDGGADGAIDAALIAVGPAGHLLMPTHSYCYVNNDGSCAPYDPAASPSRTGLITETFRNRPGAVRSGHPTHSVTAMGPRAAWMASGHAPGGGTFSQSGPHGRYVRLNAKIVFLGATLAANTTYHAVEEWLALPYLPDAPVQVARPGRAPETFVVNRPSGHRSFYRNSGLNLPNPVTEALASRGLIRPAELNDCVLLMVMARDVIRVTTEMELESPGALLCRQDSCAFCELGRHHCVRQREATRRLGLALLAHPEMCDPSHPAAE